MNRKILFAISLVIFIALIAGCIESKPVIERTKAEKKGSFLSVEAWIKNEEWGSFVEVKV